MSDDETVEAQTASGRGDFFAVDLHCWAKACGLGMNAAIAYLVMARGTLRDQRTTSWSTNAIEERTGIARPRAKAAIHKLIEAKLVRLDQGGSRPRYFLLTSKDAHPDSIWLLPPDWIWLPNVLIDGAANETAPIELVRQTSNVGALRLLVNLYHEQALQLDGGVHWRKIRYEYTREKIGESGPLIIWGFSRANKRTWEDPLAKPFMTGKSETIEVNGVKSKQDPGWDVFWKALQTLEGLGLIQFVGHLIDNDSDEGEVIHPFGMDCGERGEREIAIAAHDAALSLLTDWQAKQVAASDVWLAPIKRHLANVQLVGLLRLTYRARTSATAAWWDGRTWERWAEEYRALQDRKANASIARKTVSAA